MNPKTDFDSRLGTVATRRVRCAVCVLLFAAIAVVAQEPKKEPPTPSKPDLAKDVSSGSASLSVRAEAGRDSTVLHVNWSGQEKESLLVLAIERVLSGAHVLAPGETRLHEIVLVSRAGAQGDATVKLANERVTEYLGPIRMAEISVYLVESLTFQFLGEPTAPGKAEARVEKTEEIRPKDALTELRFVCAARDVAVLSRMMPETKPWSFDLPEGKGIRPAMQDYDKRAFREISVMFREDGVP